MSRRPSLRRCRPGAGRLALLLPLAAVLPAAAQPSSSDAQSVVVTATRTPVQASMSVADVTVVDRSALEAATGRTLADVLARQAGLQAWSSGGLGKVASVSVRGLEARHTLLLIDGVRHGSATVGAPSLDNIPIEAIDRIEIVRGPLSSLYGSDAAGGVIQVFTRGGARGLTGQATATAGSDRYRTLSGGLRFGGGLVDGAVQLQALRIGGFSDTRAGAPFGVHDPDRDGFDQNSATVQLGLQLPASWRLQASALHSRGDSRFDDGPGTDARARLRAEVASLQLAGPVIGNWRTSLRASRSIDEYDILASASPFTTLGVIGTEQRQLSWENTVATPAGTLLLLAERLDQDVSRPGTPFDVASRRIDAVALGLEGGVGAHRWQFALRRDRNSQFGLQTTGSAAYGYDLDARWRVGASAGTSFQAPSFNQLYYPGFGNPALLPEKGDHRELWLRWALGGHEVRVTAFASDIRGYITPGQNPTNVDAEVDGLSVSASAAVLGWDLSASGEWIDPRNANPRHAQFGRQLPRRAREIVRLAAERRLGSWTLGANLLRSGLRFEELANTTRLPGYTVVDLRVERSFGREWHLGLALNNAGDRRYETVLGYNQPGRQLLATLRYAGR